jgi:serine/threonine protein kinase
MIGQLLDRRYRIIRIVGSGGFGHTYLAQDLKIPGEPVCVVKHLKPASSEPAYLQIASRLFTAFAGLF